MSLKTILILFISAGAYSVISVKNDSSETSNIINTPKALSESDEDVLEIEMIMNECNQSFRIEMSYLESLNHSGSFPDETDKTPKCFIRCVLEKTGVLTEGVVDTSRAARLFYDLSGDQDSNAEEFATKCAARDEICKCERSYNFLKCLLENEIDKNEY